MITEILSLLGGNRASADSSQTPEGPIVIEQIANDAVYYASHDLETGSLISSVRGNVSVQSKTISVSGTKVSSTHGTVSVDVLSVEKDSEIVAHKGLELKASGIFDAKARSSDGPLIANGEAIKNSKFTTVGGFLSVGSDAIFNVNINSANGSIDARANQITQVTISGLEDDDEPLGTKGEKISVLSDRITTVNVKSISAHTAIGAVHIRDLDVENTQGSIVVRAQDLKDVDIKSGGGDVLIDATGLYGVQNVNVTCETGDLHILVDADETNQCLDQLANILFTSKSGNGKIHVHFAERASGFTPRSLMEPDEFKTVIDSPSQTFGDVLAIQYS